MTLWKQRAEKIVSQVNGSVGDMTGSRYFYTEHYWESFDDIDGGKVAAWIFEHEDKGWRYKR